MASIVINGRSFSCRSVSIINDHVTIDGVAQDGSLSGVVEIKVTLRQMGAQADIKVWPSEGPMWPGENSPWRYNRGNREIGSLSCATEAECWETLLAD